MDKTKPKVRKVKQVKDEWISGSVYRGDKYILLTSWLEKLPRVLLPPPPKPSKKVRTKK